MMGQVQGALDYESCGSELLAKDRTIVPCHNYGYGWSSLLLSVSISPSITTFVNLAQSHLTSIVRVKKAGMNYSH